MEDDNGIMYKLGGIEAYLRSISEKLDKSIRDNEENHKDHENRLSKVEQGQVRLFTINGTISAIVSLVIAVAGILWPK